MGESNSVRVNVSPLLIHSQVTLYGSWLISVLHTGEMLECLSRRGLHPPRHGRICQWRYVLVSELTLETNTSW